MAYLPANSKAGLLIGNYLTYVTGPSKKHLRARKMDDQIINILKGLVLIYAVIAANGRLRANQ